jgi:hypothetical protein
MSRVTGCAVKRRWSTALAACATDSGLSTKWLKSCRWISYLKTVPKFYTKRTQYMGEVMAHATLSLEGKILSDLVSIDCSLRQFGEIAEAIGLPVSVSLINLCLSGNESSQPGPESN